MEVSSAKSILPVGSTLSLRISDSNMQTVTAESYIPVLVGSGLEQVQQTGGSQTGLPNSLTELNGRLANHENFALSVKNNLEAVNIEQYISKDSYDANKTKEECEDGKLSKEVYKTGKLVEIPDNTEDKYYFRASDDSDASEIAPDAVNAADLDANLNATKYEFITILSDVEGNVRIKKSTYTGSYTDSEFHDKLIENATIIDGTNTEDSEIVVKAGSNTIEKYKMLDQKTGIISNFIYNLQRNSGNDEFAYWATQNDSGEYNWYHEAFDGLTYIHCLSPIEVKFMYSPERTSVVDPALAPASNSKGDVFSEFKLSQFKSARNPLHTLTYGEYQFANSSEAKQLNVDAVGYSKLFVSNVFLLPNKQNKQNKFMPRES